MPIKLVCLNLNRRDTWQQPLAVPAYRPASRANQKAAPKRIHQCTYTFQWCLYISWNVCSHLYTVHQLDMHTMYRFVNGMYMFIWVKTCIYLYIHVHTRLNNVHTRLYLFMYVPCTYMFILFQNCIYMVHTCVYISRNIYTCLYHVHDAYVL